MTFYEKENLDQDSLSRSSRHMRLFFSSWVVGRGCCHYRFIEFIVRVFAVMAVNFGRVWFILCVSRLSDVPESHESPRGGFRGWDGKSCIFQASAQLHSHLRCGLTGVSHEPRKHLHLHVIFVFPFNTRKSSFYLGRPGTCTYQSQKPKEEYLCVNFLLSGTCFDIQKLWTTI